MYGSMISSFSPNANLEGTLLTREQVEEISARISKSVSDNVAKQLKKAMDSSSKEKEGNKG